MKLSEFMRLAHEEVRKEYQTATIIETLVDARKRGAEAAGVTWEPEEPILADEISCSAAGDGGFLGRLARPTYKSTWYRLGYEGGAPFDAQATATEAVRRYNAWPELEKVLRAMVTGDWSKGKPIDLLTAILRGGHR